MMGITASGDVRLDAAAHAAKVAGPEYPASSAAAVGYANRRGNGSERGFGFLKSRVIREGPSDDEQTLLIHRHLRVVIAQTQHPSGFS